MFWKFALLTAVLATATPPSIQLFEQKEEKSCGAFASPPGGITFLHDISPMLKKNCTPCHFEGGKVYAKHPFDSYKAVRGLAKKLNTRLKGENAVTVNQWIAEGCPEDSTETTR